MPLIVFCIVFGSALALVAQVVRERMLQPRSANLVDHEEHEEFLRDETQRNCRHRIRLVEVMVKGFFWERSLLVTKVNVYEKGGESVMHVEQDRQTSTRVVIGENDIRREGLTPSFEVDGKPVAIDQESKVEESIRWSTTPKEFVAEKQILSRVSETGHGQSPRWPDNPARADGTGLSSEEKYRVTVDNEGREARIELPLKHWRSLKAGDTLAVLKDGCDDDLRLTGSDTAPEEEEFTPDLDIIFPGGGEIPRPDMPVAYAGRRVAVGTGNRIALLDRADRNEVIFEQAVQCGDPNASIWQVALSGNGEVLVASTDNFLCAWRLPEGRGRAELLWKWQAAPGSQYYFSSREKPLMSSLPLVISRDGLRLARAVPAAVALIDIEKGHVIRFLERERESGPTSFALHPDDPILATGWTDGFVVLWNIESGERLRTHDLWGGLFRAGRYKAWWRNAVNGTVLNWKSAPSLTWDAEGLVAFVDGILVALER